MKQQLQAIYEQGVFHPLESVVLDEHQQVTLTVVTESTQLNAKESQADHQPIWVVAQQLANTLPPEELEQMPEDGASEHDHYLYGSPKQH